MNQPIRVMIVEDHPLARAGIKRILSLEPRIAVVGEAGDGEAAVATARQCRPDVILMDIYMPKMNGIEATRAIKRELPATSVIALTIEYDEDCIIGILRAGASGYVLKDTGVETLLNTILQVSEGYPALQPLIAKKMLGFIQRGAIATVVDNGLLTNREKELLLYLARGKSNREIAKELFISEKTVKNHLTSVFRKLKVEDRAQAVEHALKRGLIDAKLI